MVSMPGPVVHPHTHTHQGRLHFAKLSFAVKRASVSMPGPSIHTTPGPPQPHFVKSYCKAILSRVEGAVATMALHFHALIWRCRYFIQFKGPAEKIVPLHSARIALHKSGLLLPLLDYLGERATNPASYSLSIELFWGSMLLIVMHNNLVYIYNLTL